MMNTFLDMFGNILHDMLANYLVNIGVPNVQLCTAATSDKSASYHTVFCLPFFRFVFFLSFFLSFFVCIFFSFFFNRQRKYLVSCS